ncbi:helicase HerA domain-containing protein, partial [Mesomycoplasma ovipneumoniae]
DNTPLFFDQFYQKGVRKNSNLFILGTSGSGKTTITKKLITYNIAVGNSVIVLDPQNEYWKIGQKLGANVVHLNSSGQSIFNPLQIRKVFNPSKDDRISNSDLIALNLAKLETFFQIVFPNLNNTSLIAIISSVKKLYSNFDFYEHEA